MMNELLMCWPWRGRRNNFYMLWNACGLCVECIVCGSARLSNVCGEEFAFNRIVWLAYVDRMWIACGLWLTENMN